MSQGYINYNSSNGYEKFFPYAYQANNALKLNGFSDTDFVKTTSNFLQEVTIAEGELSFSGNLQSQEDYSIYPITVSVKNLFFIKEYYNLISVSFQRINSSNYSYLTIGLTGVCSLSSQRDVVTITNEKKEITSFTNKRDNYWSIRQSFALNNYLINGDNRSGQLTIQGTYRITRLKVVF